jgi:hypothetical protein
LTSTGSPSFPCSDLLFLVGGTIAEIKCYLSQLTTSVSSLNIREECDYILPKEKSKDYKCLDKKSKPSIAGFSGIAGCTPSIASQWATTDVSSGALGRGASIICMTPTRKKHFK